MSFKIRKIGLLGLIWRLRSTKALEKMSNRLLEPDSKTSSQFEYKIRELECRSVIILGIGNEAKGSRSISLRYAIGKKEHLGGKLNRFRLLWWLNAGYKE